MERAKVQREYQRKDLSVVTNTGKVTKLRQLGCRENIFLNEKITLKVAANLLPGSAGEKTADGSNGDINDCVQNVTNEAAGRGFSVALTITRLLLF